MPSPLSIELALEPGTEATTPHEGLLVTLEVRNLGDESLLLPGTQDQTAGWTFELREPNGGELIRELNGLTHQAMMTRTRIDHRPDLVSLGPGDAWRWTVDLGTLHYCLPVGQHELRVVLRAEAIAARGYPTLSSNTVELEVLPVELERVEISVDNPVVTRVLVVLADERGVVLRHHDFGQPLAAWSSRRLELPTAAGASAITAQARFFDPSSFEPAFEMWLVWAEGQQVSARLYSDGNLMSERTGSLPPGHRLLRWACQRADWTLELICAADDRPGALIVLDFDHAGGINLRFTHALAEGSEAPIELVGEREGYLVLTGAEPGAALIVDDLDAAGGLIERRTLDPGGSQLRSLSLQPHRTFVAARAEGGEDSTVELIYGELSGIIRKRVCFDFAALGAEIGELAAMSRADGVWDLMIATRDGKLRYGRLLGSSYKRALKVDPQELRVIGSGQARFFPRTLATGGGCLGWFSREHGFRFRPLRHGKLVPLEDIGEG